MERMQCHVGVFCRKGSEFIAHFWTSWTAMAALARHLPRMRLSGISGMQIPTGLTVFNFPVSLIKKNTQMIICF